MDDRARLRTQAWTGDAVLGLFAREWILARPELERQFGRQELYSRLTSNQFLSSLGEPTAVEAAIGRRYREEGLTAAFAWLEAELIPRFEQQLRKQVRGGRRTGAGSAGG